MRYGAPDRGPWAGFTLVELMVVMSIIGILMIAMGATFLGWREKYRVESEIRKLYSDMMDARARALQTRRTQIVVIGLDEYQVYDDTSPAPDGDGTLQTGADTLITNTAIMYDMNLSGSVSGGIVYVFSSGRFDVATEGLVWLSFDDDTERPERDYDCISVNPTRLQLGVVNTVESGGVWVVSGTRCWDPGELNEARH